MNILNIEKGQLINLMDRYLNFKVELLSGDIEISRFDELLLSTDIVNIHPYKRIQVNGIPVSVTHSAQYIATFETEEYRIALAALPLGNVKVEITYEYLKNKFVSARKFGNFLSKFKELLGKNKIRYSIISNEISEYFAMRLYPKFQSYETKLRKIFILALSPLEDKKVIGRIKESSEGKIDFTNINTTGKIEELGIGELHDLIFEINLNPVDDYHNFFRDFELRNEFELKKLIDSIFPVTVWDRFFSKFLGDRKNDSILQKNYHDIRKFRNDVMHFHTISYRYYRRAEVMLIKAIEELEIIENSMLQSWDYESARRLMNDLSRQDLINSFNKLSETIYKVIKPTTETINNMNRVMQPLLTAINNLQLPKIDSNRTRAFQKMVQTFGELGLPNPNLDEDKYNNV